LLEERREIGKPRPHLRALDRGALEVVHARHGLAGAAVGDDAGEALATAGEGGELRAGGVVDEAIGLLHGMLPVFRTEGLKLCDVYGMALLSRFPCAVNMGA